MRLDSTTKRFRGFLRLLLFSACSLAGCSLIGCSLGGGDIPLNHYYRLGDMQQPAMGKPLLQSLYIKPVKASGLYHDRAILYIDQERPLELRRYHYHFWAEPPVQLVHQALAQGIRQSAIARQLIYEPGAERPQLLLDTRIRRFERVIDQGQVKVVVELDVMAHYTGSQGLTWTQRFASQQTPAQAHMHASAQAFSAAMQDISHQLVNALQAGVTKIN